MAKLKKRPRETTTSLANEGVWQAQLLSLPNTKRKLLLQDNDKSRHYLNLRDMGTSLDPPKLHHLTMDYPSLKHLDASSCSFDIPTIHIIEEKWIRQLKTINLAYCVCMNDRLLSLLLLGNNRTHPYPKLLKLQEINLSFTSITDYGVRLLVSLCPNLKHINLKGCSITDLSLSVIAQHISSLKELVVAECSEITDFGVSIVAQQGKENLRLLDLNDCCRITNGIFTYLCFFCTELKCLRLRNTQITNEGLQSLTHLKLDELNLDGLPVTDTLLFQLLQNQDQFKIVDLSFCHSVTTSAIIALLGTCGSLRELYLFGRNQISETIQYCNAMVKVVY